MVNSLIYIVSVRNFQKWWQVDRRRCVWKGQNFLPLFTISPWSSAYYFYCFPFFKKYTPFQNSEVATKDSRIILDLGELFIDTGEWQQSRKENLATSSFFDQSEHANFLVNQESVTLSVRFLFTPCLAGRFATSRNSFHPGSQLGQSCLILPAPGRQKKKKK